STSATSTTWSRSRPRALRRRPVAGIPRVGGAAGGRVVVIGATGQLGSDLVRTFDRPGELIPLGSRDLAVLDAARGRSTLADLPPTVGINAPAYNFVDQAEDERAAAY